MLLIVPTYFWVRLQKNYPLWGFLFVLAHYWALLKTIVQAPNYVFPSLMNDTHIVGLMNEIIPPFDHLSTQLAIVGLKVKTLKCELWNPSGISSSIEIHQSCTWGHRCLMHFGCANEFSRLCFAFFGWNLISRHDAYQWSSSLGKRTCCIGHFILMCHSLTLLSHSNNTSFFFLPIFFGEFR